MNKICDIELFLNKNKDPKYRTFITKLIPNCAYEILGVRIPKLRQFAKYLYKNNLFSDFINSPYHKYLEEFFLHRMILENFNDYNLLLKYLKDLLPYLNNWALTDGFKNNIIENHLDDFSHYIDENLNNKNPYIVRFMINMVMVYYINTDDLDKYLRKINSIKTTKYYLKMSISWFIVTAFSKRYVVTYNYFKSNKICDDDIKKMVKRKYLDSYLLTKEQKREICNILSI